jgi:hypothetical protein
MWRLNHATWQVAFIMDGGKGCKSDPDLPEGSHIPKDVAIFDEKSLK